MMSSSEIASLTNKHHGHVIRDTRVMLMALRDEPNLDHQYREEKDGRGYTAMFFLDRELTDTLLTGYSVVARRAVVRRWHQLEREEQERNLASRSKRQTRLEGKVARKALADVIEKFTEYARDQGSSNADWYYTSITTMEYRALGLVKQQGDRHFRDSLDSLANSKLAMVEVVCQHGLVAGMAKQLPYKDIFKLAQARVLTIVAALATSLPAAGAPILIEQATHPPPKKRKASSANCRPSPEICSAPTEQTS